MPLPRQLKSPRCKCPNKANYITLFRRVLFKQVGDEVVEWQHLSLVHQIEFDDEIIKMLEGSVEVCFDAHVTDLQKANYIKATMYIYIEHTLWK